MEYCVRFFGTWLVLLGLVSNIVHAEEKISIPFSDASFRIDGVLDDDIWRDAFSLDLPYQTWPRENVQASVKTTVFLAEDGKNLLVAFKAEDPEPHKIRAFLSDRDSAFSDDFVGIVLDTFNDEKRAFEFFVNPLGAQMDLIYDELTDNEDESWDAAWQAEGKINDQGFIVEMAIPLNILRFPSGLERQTWGVDLLRFRPRKHRERIANNKRDRNIACYLCQLSKMTGFSNAKPSKNLSVTPSFIASRSESRDLEENEPWQTQEKTDAGMDIRWGITPSSTLNVAINPDFSQVEADDAQLDVNTTFSLFAEEKRPFFLDSADYFDTFVDVVHTRNIVAPNAGVKFTNKSNGNTTGIILADDDTTTIILPGFDGSDVEELEIDSRNAVARYRRDIDSNLSIGAISTLKQAEDYENIVFGIDGSYQLNDSDEFQLQALTSKTQNPDSILFDDEGDAVLAKDQRDNALLFRYQHESRTWDWYYEYQDAGKDFRADLGFVTKVDYDSHLAGVKRAWYGDNDNWWSKIRTGGDWGITHRSDGQLLEEETEIFVGIDGPLDSYMEIGALQRDEFFEGEMYDNTAIYSYGEATFASGVQAGLWLRKGKDVDFDNNQQADSINIEPWLELNIGKHLLLALEVDYQKLQVASQNLLEAYSTDLRLTYQFSNRSFLRIIFQEENIERDLTLYDEPDEFDHRSRETTRQVLYSYKLTPQTVFFLGYADGGEKNDRYSRFQKDNKSFFLKLSYAWQAGAS